MAKITITNKKDLSSINEEIIKLKSEITRLNKEVLKLTNENEGLLKDLLEFSNQLDEYRKDEILDQMDRILLETLTPGIITHKTN